MELGILVQIERWCMEKTEQEKTAKARIQWVGLAHKKIASHLSVKFER